MNSSLLDIEQPDRITESGHFFFLRGWSHSGAEYGSRLTREEVVQALVAKAGPGELVEKDGRFFFRPNRTVNQPKQNPPL